MLTPKLCVRGFLFFAVNTNPLPSIFETIDSIGIAATFTAIFLPRITWIKVCATNAHSRAGSSYFPDSTRARTLVWLHHQTLQVVPVYRDAFALLRYHGNIGYHASALK